MENAGLVLQSATFPDFFLRLITNTISLLIIIRFIYYPNNHRVKFLFVFSLMGMMIFLIASILDQVRIEMGFALGLFAVFAIIRFRSPQIELKELTYLFIIIGSAIINALVEFNVETWFGLIVANFIIIGSTLIMEVYRPKNFIVKKMLVFKPSNYTMLNNKDLLRDEIISKTGINVVKVEIERINKAKEEVFVWIFFHEMEDIDESLLVTSEEDETMREE
ncbi:DUF4956 domain-containing protein [Maribellus mangrovi]|uniref:DUF4956 domain-containing protein n=1 Tax=Maribellus mangrovi TaxID=3133146 RepID=UPI0030EC3DBA